MTARRRVLILNGHLNPALACVRSLGRAGYDVLVASIHRWPLGAWSRYCVAQYRLPSRTIESFAALREWACGQRVDIVVPLLEGAALLLNAERAEWEACGMTIGCGTEEMLARAFDKGQTLHLAEACGVRIPPTRFPQSLEEARTAVNELGLPCVVKPRASDALEGNAAVHAKGIGLVNDMASLDEIVLSRRHGGQWPLIQSFVPGHTAGAFALCASGRVVAWFAHESLRDVRPLASPSCLRRSIELAPRLREPAERLLNAMRWHGPAMVEFRDDGVNPPCLMEVNGRFWHSLQLAVAAGADFPLWWIRMLEGLPIDGPTQYREGVSVRWLWGDVKRCLYTFKGPPAGYPDSRLSLWRGIREMLGPQPANTRLEMWQRNDPLPAVGEWVEGIRGVLSNNLGR
jgi:predicted ATP-grasp superfamily ATP-dependent carboligase